MTDTDDKQAQYWPSLIHAIRNARGWSQSRFADAVNSNQETVSRWERGIVTPSRPKRQEIEQLAEGSNISSLGGISHIVRLSPYPMLLCDGSDHVIAASVSSGFAEGHSVISQTPEYQHDFFMDFASQLKASGFWKESGQSRTYHFASPEHGDFKAVVVSIRIQGSIYSVVQAIPSTPQP